MRSNRSTKSFLFQQVTPNRNQRCAPEPVEAPDYLTASADLNAGIATAADKHKRQANYVLSDRINDLSLGFALDKTWENLFNNSFTKLSAIIGATYSGSGASVCAPFLFGNRLHIATIGKNPIYLVSITPDSTSITLLNKNIIHRPTMSNEFKRLTLFADSELFKRDLNLLVPRHFEGTAKKFNRKLAGSVSVSRALGFSNYEIDGLSHTPEFLHADIPTIKNGHQFIVTSSASLLSGVINAEDKIKRIVVKHKDQPLEVIAKTISAELQWSLSMRRSNAVCVMPVIAPKTLPEHITYAAVISGHHNNTVADVVFKHFHTIFADEIEKISLLEHQQTIPVYRAVIDNDTLITTPLVSPLRI